MIEPTDADRATAENLMRDVYGSSLTGDPAVRDRIAGALAAERERALLPVRRLAEDWTHQGRRLTGGPYDPVDVLIASTFKAAGVELRQVVDGVVEAAARPS